MNPNQFETQVVSCPNDLIQLETIAHCCDQVIVQAPFRGPAPTPRWEITGCIHGRTPALFVCGDGDTLSAAIHDFVKTADDVAPGWSTSATSRG